MCVADQAFLTQNWYFLHSLHEALKHIQMLGRLMTTKEGGRKGDQHQKQKKITLKKYSELATL